MEQANGRRRAGRSTFPHVLAKTVSPFTAQWQRSPFADEYLGRLAASAISELELGRGKGIDFMSVSFSSLDLVGHLFGPASHEVQDVVLRLDRTIGALLDHLDKTVGRGRYVVALSADHGVGSLPEQSESGGRQGGPEALAAINDALVPFFGEGKYAVHSAYTDLYLAPGVRQKLEANPKAASAVLAALKALPAVAHAFFASEIAGADARTSSDPVRRAAALNYHPDTQWRHHHRAETWLDAVDDLSGDARNLLRARPEGAGDLLRRRRPAGNQR